uniref:Uncharacterized protein n=1 Tax=viral metagenome TaxID=1070528 RepID=A0A6M3LJS3_9ZZZZ
MSESVTTTDSDGRKMLYVHVECPGCSALKADLTAMRERARIWCEAAGIADIAREEWQRRAEEALGVAEAGDLYAMLDDAPHAYAGDEMAGVDLAQWMRQIYSPWYERVQEWDNALPQHKAYKSKLATMRERAEQLERDYVAMRELARKMAEALDAIADGWEHGPCAGVNYRDYLESEDREATKIRSGILASPAAKALLEREG